MALDANGGAAVSRHPFDYGGALRGGTPSIWLVGQDGKVVTKDLRGDEIKAAVGRALGK